MKTRLLVRTFIALSALSFAGKLSRAAQATESTVTIYTDNFNRTGDLAGSSPVVGENAPSWAIGATYTASSDLALANDRVEVAINKGSSNAYLPVSLAPDSGIYTLTLTLAAIRDESIANWVAFGFAIGTTRIDEGFFSDSRGWASYSRGATFTGYGNTNSQFGSVAQVNGTTIGTTPLTVSIILDTYKTTDNLTFKILNGGTAEKETLVSNIVGTLDETYINSLKAIKFGAYNGQQGQFDDLLFTVTTITQVPEPGTTAALIAFAVSGMAILIRRRATR
ncbi:MAG: hypothetical protein LBK99_21425 [Opitutaceae bacterium]|jgi:hypothetical protein|nr:hypothetical protein [Opitutaceae bacterium]